MQATRKTEKKAEDPMDNKEEMILETLMMHSVQQEKESTLTMKKDKEEMTPIDIIDTTENKTLKSTAKLNNKINLIKTYKKIIDINFHMLKY